jgi:hypothetical protein
MKKLTILYLLAIATSGAKAQLINPDFEDWQTDTNSTTPYASSWLQGNSKYCYKETNAQHGSYALQVSVWYYYVKTTAVQKVATSTRPFSLEGFYTYTENQVRSLSSNNPVTDTALASVLMTKWNTTTMMTDTVGFGKTWLYGGGNNYTHFSCPINYSSAAIPDSITVVFDPSLVRRYANVTDFQAITSNGKCSFLTIDNVSLQQFPTGIPVQSQNDDIIVFPNPATDYIQVNTKTSEPYTLSILDMGGRLVKQEILNQQNNRVSLKAFSTGNYEILVADKGQQIVTREKLTITK